MDVGAVLRPAGRVCAPSKGLERLGGLLWVYFRGSENTLKQDPKHAAGACAALQACQRPGSHVQRSARHVGVVLGVKQGFQVVGDL